MQYHSEGVELYNGDCLDVLRQLPADSVDLVLTDPPYGIGYKDRRGRGIQNDARPFIWWLHDAFRVTREGG